MGASPGSTTGQSPRLRSGLTLFTISCLVKHTDAPEASAKATPEPADGTRWRRCVHLE